MIAKLLFGASIVVGLIASESVRPFAENHPWRVALLLAAVAALAGLAFLAQVVLSEAPNLLWIGPALLLLGGGGWGLVEGWDARDNYLTPYCEYGADTAAERDRCLETVHSDDIDELDTPAAEFARGETSECAAGAGRLCDKPGIR